MSKRKEIHIGYTREQLVELSKDTLLFLQLIHENQWMKGIYAGDWDYNEKLQFIRLWYANWMKPQAKQKVDKQGQIKLL